MSTEAKLKVPKPATQEALFQKIEDEDYRFNKIKCDRDTARLNIQTPTADDDGNIVSVKEFHGVVALARKNFFQSDEEREEGKEASEKRTLYIVEQGKVEPKVFYVSTSGVRNWLALISACQRKGVHYSHVLVKFTADRAENKVKGFKWTKPKFEVAGVLSDEEIAYVNELGKNLLERVQKYEVSPEAAAAEEAMMEGRIPGSGSVVAKPTLDDEEREEKPKASTKPKEEKPKPAPSLDDESPEALAENKGKKEEEKPASGGDPSAASKLASLDDDEE